MGFLAMQKLVQHPVFVLVVTVLAVVLYVSLEQTGDTAQSSVDTLSTLQAETQQLEQEVQQLESEVAAAESSLAKERIARNELLLQKPGEYVMQLPPLPSATPMVAPTPTPNTPWQEWKKILL